jgi:hypothetical protein
MAVGDGSWQGEVAAELTWAEKWKGEKEEGSPHGDGWRPFMEGDVGEEKKGGPAAQCATQRWGGRGRTRAGEGFGQEK